MAINTSNNTSIYDIYKTPQERAGAEANDRLKGINGQKEDVQNLQNQDTKADVWASYKGWQGGNTSAEDFAKYEATQTGLPEDQLKAVVQNFQVVQSQEVAGAEQHVASEGSKDPSLVDNIGTLYEDYQRQKPNGNPADFISVQAKATGMTTAQINDALNQYERQLTGQ